LETIVGRIAAFKCQAAGEQGPLRQWKIMRYCGTLAAVFATVFATLGTGFAQDFMAGPGALAAAFPKPNRPVADIISPIWHDEKERDAAGEQSQLIRLLGIKSGMTIADIGAGSGYHVVRLSPIVGDRARLGMFAWLAAI